MTARREIRMELLVVLHPKKPSLCRNFSFWKAPGVISDEYLSVCSSRNHKYPLIIFSMKAMPWKRTPEQYWNEIACWESGWQSAKNSFLSSSILKFAWEIDCFCLNFENRKKLWGRKTSPAANRNDMPKHSIDLIQLRHSIETHSSGRCMASSSRWSRDGATIFRMRHIMPAYRLC